MGPKAKPAGKTQSQPSRVPSSRVKKSTDRAADAAGDSGEKDSDKKRASEIPWAKNPDWLAKAVEYLTNNPAFRIKLFSDSTEDATSEGRKKHVGKESKINMYSTLAQHVFGDSNTGPEGDEDIVEVVSEEYRAAYAADSSRYAKSTQQQFSRLKTEYSKHVKELYQTGGGLKPEDQQSNLIEKIKGLFPHWDELDGFWRELPNYNPIGVSNASSGADHAAAATSLFLKKCNNDDAGESSGIEDGLGFEVLPGSRGRSASSARSVGDEIDELYSEPERKPAVAVKKPAKKMVNSEKNPNRTTKPTKTGEKRPFDLTDLDEAHRQDMADSARRQDHRIELEVKRTELELERERNKKRKLELEAERIRMEREDRQDRMRRDEDRDNRFFGMMSSMMGRGTGMHASTSSASISNSSTTSNYNFDDDFSAWNLRGPS
ncbi:hypothetical protein DFH08DRAFT_759748 [Mycena albidolilacea]|uniref:Uncharacterized protein n=1 Tax=Mycena albidolilacea TaxID=1033008 RepID=A0AAD6YZA5_9AGAR|nr:hypothetical protein DFH08DRAFT_759748 [Mycena albidolilacea]